MDLLDVQEELKSQINKLRINFKKCSKERLTRQYIETRLQALESKYKDFTKNHVELIKNRSSLTSNYFSDDEFGTLEEYYLEFKTELKEKLEKYVVKQRHDNSLNISASADYHSTVKLPKITLPIFSGKYMEWPSFHDLFQSLIHQNSTLTEVEKLHYLKTHLSSEAEQLLRHIPITAGNYEQCWELLKSRYSNKRYIANCILTRLVGQKTCTTESSNGVKQILDTTSDCLNGLKNIGVDVSSWDILILHLTALKLDTESRKQWEQKISDHSNVLPTFMEFKSFLESRFRALEYLEPVRKENTKEKVERTKAFTVTATICPLCSGNHLLFQCKEFSKQDTTARREFVEKKRLCFNCFSDNHPVFRCKRNTFCRRCGRKHHSLLHPERTTSSSITRVASTNSELEPIAQTSTPKDDNVNKHISIAKEQDSVTHIASHFANNSKFSTGHVMLATALIKVDCYRNSYTLRALLDQGSQASFISEYAVQLLGLRKHPVKGLVTGLGGDQLSLEIKHMVTFDIQSVHTSFSCNIQAYVLTNLSSTLPASQIEITDWPEILQLPLADPGYGKPQGIDVLLGAEIYGQILIDGLLRNPSGTLTAQNTMFGWILSGRALKNPNIDCFNNIISLHIQDESVNALLRKFWELETEVHQELMSAEDERCEAYYCSTTTRDDNGRYIVKLPFKETDPKSQYGEFKGIAERRLKSLEKKFEKNHFLKQEYTKAMKDYITTNHMERITDPQELEKNNCVYLPHHAVIRDDKTTTRVRVVFDASCKGIHGKSLNDDLLVGPRLQEELRHIIMRWRTHPICFTADIVKMYRQILVDKADTDFQRLLWRENPDSDIEVYRMLRVTFGVTSAPYLAVKTLQQLAKDEGHTFPRAAEIVTKDFYMDDCLSGCMNDDEAIEIYHQMVALLQRGGFELQKWMSNSSKLMEFIHGNVKTTKSMNIKDEEVVKILGLSWNANKDVFQYTVHLPKQTKSITKRVILSNISRLFDPLGWIAPVVIQAKIYMQKLWLKGLSWDEEVPQSLLNEWNEYRNNLPVLNSFQISRWVGMTGAASVEVHGFCDASNSAYAAVAYLRVIDETGVHIALVAARTKVAPVKQVSTPRLELCGAVLLSKLLLEVSAVLNIPQSKLYAWTDSTIVLAWLKGDPTRWKTFVANRVTEILNVLNNDQWRHVQSGDNPADMASRGLTPQELMNKKQFWMHGPQWLQEATIPVISNVSINTNLEEKQVKSHMTTGELSQPMTVWDKYSSLKKLTRVIAYCRRFISKLKDKTKQFSKHLTVKELEEATTLCLRNCQASAFQDELTQLRQDKFVKRSSRTFSLCPFLDKNGLMRVRGRIQQSMEDYETKHPIILPYGHHLSRLVVANAHEETLHGGPQLTLNYIRSRFWIINAKSLVRQHIKKCLRCIRYSSSHQNPFMGELPSSRVTISRPFSRSGVDYAGPVNIRMSKGRGCKSYKGYICLFICMATKAIHLEAVTDLTSEAFLAAFRRLVARRGFCTELWSDNGTNFVGAAKELRNLFRPEDTSVMSEVAASLANKGTEWHFIPPRAPNFGGLWEAGVRSTKHHLKRVLDGSTLTYEELSTVLAQIEACLNSRPMYRLPSNQEDSSPLTPGHFLIGEPLLTVPDHKYENCEVSNLRRWQIIQKMVQQFWRKWSQEYLSTLHNRYKWTKIFPEPNIGDIVLVKEDDLPPSKWLLGRIEAKHPGPDQITRVVTLKCKGSKFKRPVSKLCILPIAD